MKANWQERLKQEPDLIEIRYTLFPEQMERLEKQLKSMYKIEGKRVYDSKKILGRKMVYFYVKFHWEYDG